MDSDKRDDAALDALFAAGEKTRPAPGDDFLARLAADADRAMPRPAPKAAAPRRPVFGGLRGLFAATGLSGAAALGVLIGFVMPDLVTTYSPLADDTVALSAFLPATDLAVLE